ncbi:5'-flap endonuclease [Neonectria punicea]|uniref:Structure-specific endonuclease subunit SLX4 n=1 Tax=Neonectria punicea TaxID=979145 RepID=A0ABR1GQ45_9HYPO
MTSPDAFRSSPPRDTRREGLVVGSSSPDLPPLHDILSQRSSRPPLRSGSKAAPIPDDAPTSFISARNIWKATDAASVAPVVTPDEPPVEAQCDGDASVLIVEIPPKPQSKRRKPRAPKGTVKKDVGESKATDEPKPKVQRTRKKAQPKAKITEQKDGNSDAGPEIQEPKPKTSKAGGKKQTGTTSHHFASAPEPDLVAKPKKTITNEPLALELAPARRVDWTPPAQKTIINIDSGSSAIRPPTSVEGGRHTSTSFGNLLQSYKCPDEAPQETSALVDEDSSFLKKRKRIELVVTKDSNPPEVATKSPTKKKAPKKKARTITELATAAYKQATQPDVEPTPESILNHFPPYEADPATTPAEPSRKGKGKPPARKRASRAKTKKTPPPKPILLSPGAALNQVAKQDFVFGTSSQLAREPSPTVLRDLQAAVKLSSLAEFDDFVTPINSDAIEPLEHRPKLWGAGARDTEGDLFDVEVINLTEGSPQLPVTNPVADPFGYSRSDDHITPTVTAKVLPSEGDDSFVNLSDILPSPGQTPVQFDDGDSPFFSESDISASTDILEQASRSRHSPKAPAGQPVDSGRDRGSIDQPSRPNYELLTDIQLAKEIRTFGFKPIKRRNAMIALLDQCWQSKARTGQASIHTSATLSAVVSQPTPAAPAPAAIPAKRPRGRPRKDSASTLDAQEPPPSAQPPETPKRPRGRPRKDSAVPSPTATIRSRAKSKSPKKSGAAQKSPRRKKATVKPAIEIPDSESDNESEMASSPSSSVERMFSSPPPLDLSLSMTEDTQLSLTTSPSDQQAIMFDHITKAIKSTSRTTDPANPSWHEKILLYDPIVLEDLAAWLNSGELTRAGFDGEISPGEVKKWCESKSVCCLWKVNLRGKERKRF